MEVGVRELKASLSRYLARAEEGETITVTSRGKAIARVMPAANVAPAKLAAMISSGEIRWSGRPLTLPEPIVPSGKSGLTMADIVSELRD